MFSKIIGEEQIICYCSKIKSNFLVHFIDSHLKKWIFNYQLIQSTQIRCKITINDYILMGAICEYEWINIKHINEFANY